MSYEDKYEQKDKWTYELPCAHKKYIDIDGQKHLVGPTTSAGTHMHTGLKEHQCQSPSAAPWPTALGPCVGEQSTWAWSWTYPTSSLVSLQWYSLPLHTNDHNSTRLVLRTKFFRLGQIEPICPEPVASGTNSCHGVREGRMMLV
jgi:hypothetical protein